MTRPLRFSPPRPVLAERDGPWLRLACLGSIDIVPDGGAIWFRHAGGVSRFERDSWTHAIGPRRYAEQLVAAGGRLWMAGYDALANAADGRIETTPPEEEADGVALLADGPGVWWARRGRISGVLRVDRVGAGAPVSVALRDTALRRLEGAFVDGGELVLSGRTENDGPVALLRVGPRGAAGTRTLEGVFAWTARPAGRRVFLIGAGTPERPPLYVLEGGEPRVLAVDGIDTVSDVFAVPGGFAFLATTKGYRSRPVVLVADETLEKMERVDLRATQLARAADGILVYGARTTALWVVRPGRPPRLVRRGRGRWSATAAQGTWISVWGGLYRRGARVVLPALSAPWSPAFHDGRLLLGGALAEIVEGETARDVPVGGAWIMPEGGAPLLLAETALYRLEGDELRPLATFRRLRTLGVPAWHDGRVFVALERSRRNEPTRALEIAPGAAPREFLLAGLPGFGYLGGGLASISSTLGVLGFFSTGADLYFVGDQAVARRTPDGWRTVQAWTESSAGAAWADRSGLFLVRESRIVRIVGDRVASVPRAGSAGYVAAMRGAVIAGSGVWALDLERGTRALLAQGEFQGVAADGDRLALVETGALRVGTVAAPALPAPAGEVIRSVPTVTDVVAGDGGVAVVSRGQVEFFDPSGGSTSVETEIEEPVRLSRLGAGWCLTARQGAVLSPGGAISPRIFIDRCSAVALDASGACVAWTKKRLDRTQGYVDAVFGVSERFRPPDGPPLRRIDSLLRRDGAVYAAGREGFARRRERWELLPWDSEAWAPRGHRRGWITDMYERLHLLDVEGDRVFATAVIGGGAVGAALCADFAAKEVRPLALWILQEDADLRVKAPFDGAPGLTFAGRAGPELFFWGSRLAALDVDAERWRECDEPRRPWMRGARKVAVAPWGFAVAHDGGFRIVREGRVVVNRRMEGVRLPYVRALFPARDGLVVLSTRSDDPRWAVDVREGGRWSARLDGPGQPAGAWEVEGEVRLLLQDGSIVGMRGTRTRTIAEAGSVPGLPVGASAGGSVALVDEGTPRVLVRWPDGLAWEALDVPVRPEGSQAAADGERLWLWTAGSLFRRRRGEGTWERLVAVPRDAAAAGFLAVSGDRAWVGTHPGPLYFDGGRGWLVEGGPDDLSAGVADDAGRLWGAGLGGFWAVDPSSRVMWTGPSCAVPQHATCVALEGARVWCGYDGGIAWTERRAVLAASQPIRLVPV